MTTQYAILAGGGYLPVAVSQRILAQGDNALLITFTGQPQPDDILEGVTHIQQALGAVGHTLKLLKEHGVEKVVLAGYLSKPKLFTLRPDVKGIALLSRVVRKHDDELLKAVCQLLEEEGMQLVSAQDICPNLLAPEGALGKISPDSSCRADIEIGKSVLQHMSSLDIGQAVLVKDKTVLGVEAVEGTDGLIERCVSLRGEGEKGGVLVKFPKTQQTQKADLPAIGPKTIEQLAQYGYQGVAVQASGTLLLEREKLIEAADAAGLFVIGLPKDG